VAHLLFGAASGPKAVAGLPALAEWYKNYPV
jgi:hypothetical protein